MVPPPRTGVEGWRSCVEPPPAVLRRATSSDEAWPLGRGYASAPDAGADAAGPTGPRPRDRCALWCTLPAVHRSAHRSRAQSTWPAQPARSLATPHVASGSCRCWDRCPHIGGSVVACGRARSAGSKCVPHRQRVRADEAVAAGRRGQGRGGAGRGCRTRGRGCPTVELRPVEPLLLVAGVGVSNGPRPRDRSALRRTVRDVHRSAQRSRAQVGGGTRARTAKARETSGSPDSRRPDVPLRC